MLRSLGLPYARVEAGGTRGGLAGVVTADLSLAWLQEIVSAVKIYNTGYAFLISQNGVFVTHPQPELVLRESIFSLAEGQGDAQLREVGRSMIRGEQGFAPSRDYVSGKKIVSHS